MAIKDFMHALFKEEVDDETEETSVLPETQPESPAAVVTEAEFEEPRDAEPVRTAPEPVKAEPVQDLDQHMEVSARQGTRSSIFSGLDMEEVGKAPVSKKTRPTYKFDRSKLSKAGNGEEYQAVISPIFGNIEDEKKEYEKVHNAVELPRPEEGFSMTTVISPMFGNDLPEQKPVERIPDYRKRETKKPAPVRDLLDTKRTEGYDPDPLLPVDESNTK